VATRALTDEANASGRHAKWNYTSAKSCNRAMTMERVNTQVLISICDQAIYTRQGRSMQAGSVSVDA